MRDDSWVDAIGRLKLTFSTTEHNSIAAAVTEGAETGHQISPRVVVVSGIVISRMGASYTHSDLFSIPFSISY